MRTLVRLAALLIAIGQSDPTTQELLVPTKAGVPLRVAVTRPSGEPGARPTVLFYTTYDAPFATNAGKRAAERGFVGVVVYARGLTQICASGCRTRTMAAISTTSSTGSASKAGTTAR